MTVSLNTFTTAANQTPAAGRLWIDQSGDGLVRSKRGFFGKLTEHQDPGNAQKNRAVMDEFRTAMRGKYGSEITDKVFLKIGLDTRYGEGKSLGSDAIKKAVVEANKLLPPPDPKGLTDLRGRHLESVSMPVSQGRYLKENVDTGICLALSLTWARENMKEGNTMGDRLGFVQGSGTGPSIHHDEKINRLFTPLKEMQRSMDGNAFESPTLMHKSLNKTLSDSGITDISCSIASKFQFIDEDSNPGELISGALDKLGPGHYVLGLFGREGIDEKTKQPTVGEGHAIGVHKREDGSYALLEPNVGEFVFKDIKALNAFLNDIADKGDFAQSYRGMTLVAVDRD